MKSKRFNAFSIPPQAVSHDRDRLRLSFLDVLDKFRYTHPGKWKYKSHDVDSHCELSPLKDDWYGFKHIIVRRAGDSDAHLLTRNGKQVNA